MERSEQETIICINNADLDDGFFSIWTTQENIYQRICKRIGKENFLSCDIGNRSWDIKIPKKYLQKGLGLRARFNSNAQNLHPRGGFKKKSQPTPPEIGGEEEKPKKHAFSVPSDPDGIYTGSSLECTNHAEEYRQNHGGNNAWERWYNK